MAAMREPRISAGRYLGGAAIDRAYACAGGANGDLYVAGVTTSIELPDLALPDARRAAGDGFIVQFDPTGTTVKAVVFVGGSGADAVYDVAADASGVYVAGVTESDDFPTTEGAFRTGKEPGARVGFVVKYDPSLTSILYSTFLSTDASSAVAITVAAQEATVAGAIGRADSPFTMRLTRTADDFIFLATLPEIRKAYDVAVGPDGTTFVVGTTTVGNSEEYNQTVVSRLVADRVVYDFDIPGAIAYLPETTAFVRRAAIAATPSGEVWVVGAAGANLPTTQNAFQSQLNGGSDAFVVRLTSDPASPALAYASYFGGDGLDGAHDLALDRAGNVFVGGMTLSKSFPVMPKSSLRPDAPFDGFVVSLTASGGLVYSTRFGGVNNDEVFGVAVTDKGVAVCGRSASVNLPVVASDIQQGFRGIEDGFLIHVQTGGERPLRIDSVSSVSSLSGLCKSSELQVSGAGFQPNATAIVDGFAATVTVETATTLTIESLTHPAVPQSRVEIRNPDGELAQYTITSIRCVTSDAPGASPGSHRERRRPPRR